MSDSTAVIQYQSAEVDRFLPVMSLEMAVDRREMIVSAVSKLMRTDEDYGTIPGTKKPSLWQPGADKLCNLFGLVPRFSTTEKTEDWTGAQHAGEPFFFYRIKCTLMRGEYVMGEGEGSCNSWESKYRYRKSERVCPACGKENIRKSKPKADGSGGGWYCWTKTGGCGATFKDGDQAIEGQQTGNVPNPDICDMPNTILKMAAKRAKIAATLNATSAHEFFTQDVEDMKQPPVEDTPAARNDIPQPPKNGGVQGKTAKAAQPAGTEREIPDAPTPGQSSPFKAMLDKCAEAKASIGSAHYYRVLKEHGLEHANEIPDIATGKIIIQEMRDVAKAEKAFNATDADLPAELREQQL